MASRTEKQKSTYYDHFAKRWRVDGKSKRAWLSYLKKAANKKFRKEKKKEMDEVTEQCGKAR